MNVSLLQVESINDELTSWFPSLVNLCYVLSALFGLIAAVKIYNRWQLHSRHHLTIDADIAAWVFAAIFFLAARLFIKLVLGL
jgi:hypothetical protein